MKITPIDIAHKSFNKKMFGLDENEVLDFMQNLAAQMEELIHDRNSLKELVREKEIQLNEFKERDQILKSTIATASQMSDRLRSDAEREAKLIIADAQQKAEIIVRDSRDSLRKIYNEISELKRARLQFEANLKALAQAHLTLLEQGDRFMPNIGLNSMTVEAETTMNSRSSEVSPLSIR
ncbi:MAG: DivIVA domain-containing protein [Pseudobdellovibrionaceae bacterium]